MVLNAAVSYVALEQLERSLAHSEATEAFGFMQRLFDNFGRLLRNVRVTLLGVNKTFKRSELHAYHDSNMRLLKFFFSTHTFDYNTMVPIPSGMKVGYLEATTTLESLYTALQIDVTTATLLRHFEQIAGTGSHPPHDIAATTTVIDRLSKEGTETTLRGIFSAAKTHDVPLGSVVHSFEELVDLNRRILGYDTIFQNVEKVCADLDRIEQAIDRIVTELEQQPTRDKAYVQSLYKLVRTASVQFDMYGVILAEMQRVEHNFVFVLKVLVAKLPKK